LTYIPRAQALTTFSERFPFFSSPQTVLENWSKASGECTPVKVANRWNYDEAGFVAWLDDIEKSLVFLQSDSYDRCLTFAIEAYYMMTRADFGASQQRDLGKFITNQVTGKLGELALREILLQRQGLLIDLDFSITGQIPSQDIERISTREVAGKPLWNVPAIKTSIKSTKLKNYLLALPPGEVSQEDRRSDIYALVQVDLPQDHLLRSLKNADFAPMAAAAALVPDLGRITARIAGWTTYQEVIDSGLKTAEEIGRSFGVEMRDNYVLPSSALHRDIATLADKIIRG